MASSAAAVACRAAAIFVAGAFIDPEQSMMMISAALAAGAAAASIAPDDVTVTIALTSRPWSGRNSFWKISTVKSGWLIWRAPWIAWVGRLPAATGTWPARR